MTENDGPAFTVEATDGTAIACWRSGTGEALLLVHGASSDHTRWRRVLPELEARFAVHALDRRGRGGSGDSGPYTLDREYDDVVAVANRIGPQVHLVGHSYGAIVALEAAGRLPGLRSLTLYEPEIAPVPEPPDAAMLAQLEAATTAGDHERVLEVFFSEAVGLDAEGLAFMRSLPTWPARLRAAPTIAREIHANAAYRFDPARFREIEAPALLLVGEQSSAYAHRETEVLANTLWRASVVELAGQGHVAMDTGPDVFLSALIPFLNNASA